MVNLLFYCHIISYWEKVTSYEKCWQIVEFSNISIKMKNFKTFYNAQTASRFKKTKQIKVSYVSGKKILTEIYGNIQKFAFQVLPECTSCVSRNGAVPMFFLTPTRNIFAGKDVK